MSDLIHKTSSQVTQRGNGKAVFLPKTYREAAGLDEDGTEVEIALLHGKHGVFLGFWKKGQQPDLEEVDEYALKRMVQSNSTEDKTPNNDGNPE